MDTERRRNRQCGIGYHDECSDPFGESCECECHPWILRTEPVSDEEVERAAKAISNIVEDVRSEGRSMRDLPQSNSYWSTRLARVALEAARKEET